MKTIQDQLRGVRSTRLRLLCSSAANTLDAKDARIADLVVLVRLGYLDGYTDGEVSARYEDRHSQTPCVKHYTPEEEWLNSVTFAALNPKETK